MLRSSALVMSVSAVVVLQPAFASTDAVHWRPAKHGSRASPGVLWNPLLHETTAPERGAVDSESYRRWIESIDDDRYRDFLARDGVLPASGPVEPDPVVGFGRPKASALDLDAGDDILEIIESGRAGMSELDDPVRRWCAAGGPPSRFGAEHGPARDRFFLGRGRGIADGIDLDLLHEMVFEVPAVMADRYDADGDGVPEDVIAVDLGGVVFTHVVSDGDAGGSGMRSRDDEARCVVTRSAAIEDWLRRRRGQRH